MTLVGAASDEVVWSGSVVLAWAIVTVTSEALCPDFDVRVVMRDVCWGVTDALCPGSDVEEVMRDVCWATCALCSVDVTMTLCSVDVTMIADVVDCLVRVETYLCRVSVGFVLSIVYTSASQNIIVIIRPWLTRDAQTLE